MNRLPLGFGIGRRSVLVCLLGLGWGLLLVGCSTLSGEEPIAEAPLAEEGLAAMDQHRLEMLFADEVEAITGPAGALQSQVRGIPIYLLSDASSDRMRLFAAIARMEDLAPELRDVLLTANFHSTLDARYAFSNGFVFSAFLHPISSLSPELLHSALEQVVSLVENFGTTYSSGGLAFSGRDKGDDS